jgi:sugar lactone lactonase YvrE
MLACLSAHVNDRAQKSDPTTGFMSVVQQPRLHREFYHSSRDKEGVVEECADRRTLSSSSSRQPSSMEVLAGSGSEGFADGAGAAAQFHYPWGVAVDGEGSFIIGDNGNNRVLKISPDGTVSTLAGSGIAGFADGAGAAAEFNGPRGVAVDGEGSFIIADSGNHRVRKITPEGTVSTLAGSGSAGFADGAGAAAQFNYPYGVAVDGEGSIIITDQENQRVRKLTRDGTVSTLAGSGIAGFADGAGAAAQFTNLSGVAVDGEGSIIIADHWNQRVRKITPNGTVSTLAGYGSEGFADGAGAAAQFDGPVGVAVDGEGSILITDNGNQRVRKITPDGTVSTLFAGSCSFQGVAIDADGCVVVCTDEHTVAKIAGCRVAAPRARAQVQAPPCARISEVGSLLDDTTKDAERMDAEKKEAEAQRMEAEKKALEEECERKRCAEAPHHARAAFSSLRSPL